LSRSQAEAAGFKIDEVVADHGVSGVTTKLADRPGGRRLLDKVRAGDQVIVRWVDRLGRNYDDATATIRHLMNEGVVTYVLTLFHTNDRGMFYFRRAGRQRGRPTRAPLKSLRDWRRCVAIPLPV
jgi:hypothetical protein